MNQRRKGAPEKGAHKINQHGQHSRRKFGKQIRFEDDEFSALDREFFASTPDRNYRIRGAFPGEIPARQAALGMGRPWQVLAIRLSAPGDRAVIFRQPFAPATPWDDGELSGVACAIATGAAAQVFTMFGGRVSMPDRGRA